MYVCMYVCMYACMYVCMNVSTAEKFIILGKERQRTVWIMTFINIALTYPAVTPI
jgi:hypothetical protein